MKKLRFEASAGIMGQFGWVRVNIFTFLRLVLTECVTRIRWTNEKLPTFDEAILRDAGKEQDNGKRAK